MFDFLKKKQLPSDAKQPSTELVVAEPQETTICEIETNKGNFSIDALFSYIGYEPSASFLDSITMDNNYIVVDEHMKTNIDSIYACGDIIKKDVYQIVTSAHDGVIAASDIIKNTF